MLEINQIYNMDCIEGMKQIPDNSIDSIVTDPPYELGFMGKSWDSTGIAYNIELWKECLRVLKHGGHLLAFGGTRTYHRVACAIEDAGFEIRDCIQWLYGSGFPKSHDISKAIDKKLGAERNRIKFAQSNTWREKEGRMDRQATIPDNNPATPEAQQWVGWGTCLKPANEPIVLARKPLSEKTVAENVLKWGTGGINIDDCRVEYDMTDTNPATNPLYRKENGYKIMCGNDNDGSSFKIKPEPMEMNVNNKGRFPANVILDEEAGKILDEQSGITISKDGGKSGTHFSAGNKGVKRTDARKGHNDSGGASRFFYCAKASKKERGEGNNHPTVKPLSLIKYLITLVTPPEGICLDPFEGSGTHQRACIALGFNYIGFEIDKDYFKIIQSRADNVQIKMV